MSIVLSIITVAFIGGIAGFLGTLLITERMALIGGPFGHLALPGVALALLYGFDVFWGALGAIAISAIIIWSLGLISKLPTEALIGVVFSGMVALGFLVLPIEEAEEALIGDITQVTLFDTMLAVIIGIGAYILIKKIYPGMILSGISEDLAIGEGVAVKRYRFLYLITVALVVALEVKIVGILLTAALMAIPAAAASNFSHKLSQYRWNGLLIGAVSGVGGVFLFRATGLPAGPLIVLCSTAFFLISLLATRK